MERAKQLPRLTREDVRELGRAAQELDAAAAVLMQSSWQAKLAVLTLLEHVKRAIADLYNRSEAAYLEQLSRVRPEMPQDAPREVAATVEAGGVHTAAPGQGEP